MDALAPHLPCPTCGGRLAQDGAVHVCRGCGRPFTVKPLETTGIAIYREARRFDLVAAREPTPTDVGLRIEKDDDESLDVHVGRPRLLAVAQDGAVWSLLAVATFVTLVLSQLATPVPLFSLLVPASVLLMFVVQRALRLEYDRLAIGDGKLSCIRYRLGRNPSALSIDLARIEGVHAEDDVIRLTLDDGKELWLGQHVNIPPSVRRWLARRIAGHLPVPSEATAIPALPPAGAP